MVAIHRALFRTGGEGWARWGESVEDGGNQPGDLNFTVGIILLSALYEIKRCLLLGRNTMTNLDSILKSRDITLPTKVHIVRAMVFPSSHVWM